MRSPTSNPGRSGSTLAELVVSLTATSALLIGLNSALLVALQASERSLTPALAVLEGNAALAEMQGELQYALTMSGKGGKTVTATVADRNADSKPETIRYEWSGVAGDPLTRRYNSGDRVTVVENVHDFHLTYYEPASAVEYVNVRLQIGGASGASLQTAIPMLNRP